MTYRVYMLLKSSGKMARFRACLVSGLAKDLSAVRNYRNRQATDESIVHAHCMLDN